MRGDERLPAHFAGRRTGATVGIHLGAALTSRIGVQTGLRYVQTGGVVDRRRFGPADGLENETARYQLGIVSMPILGTYEFGSRTSPLRPTLVVGAAGQRLLRSTVQSTVTSQRRAPYRLNSTPESVRPMGVTMIVGGDLAYTLAKGRDVILKGRYSYGVTDLVDGPEGTHVRMGSFTVGIQYALPL
jgi:hypothetical protein